MTSNIDPVWIDLAHQMAQAESEQQEEPTPTPAPQQQRRQWRRREEI